jgi:hypothetical protein
MKALRLVMFVLSIVMVVALASACSGTRKPVAALAKAELAVKEAGQSTAPQHAELDLKLAREKLEKARGAIEDDDNEKARWLAEEALVDAQVAEVKADSAEARATAAQTRESIERIRNEAYRAVPVERRETVETIRTETYRAPTDAGR